MSDNFYILLLAANQRLIDLNARITIERRGKKLYLRGIFPPKPDSKCPKSYQQVVALGIDADAEGLKVAIAESIKIGIRIAIKVSHSNRHRLVQKLKSQKERETRRLFLIAAIIQQIVIISQSSNLATLEFRVG